MISAATCLIWLCSWWRSGLCSDVGKRLGSSFRGRGWGCGLGPSMLLGLALSGWLCICSCWCGCAGSRDRQPGQSRAESVLCDQCKPCLVQPPRSARPMRGEGKGWHGQDRRWQTSRELGGVRWCRMARCRWRLDSRLIGRGGVGLALRSLATSRGSSGGRTRRLVALEGLHPARDYRAAHETTSPQKQSSCVQSL